MCIPRGPLHSYYMYLKNGHLSRGILHSLPCRFFELFAKYNGYKKGHLKLKKPKQLQEVLVYVFNNTSETAAGGTGLCIQ